MAKVKRYLLSAAVISIILLGLFLRLNKIDFGIPYSFLYDETDIYDNVIKYAFNYKFIIANDDLKEFSPPSYVYGMFPTYFLTICVIILNKLISIFKFTIDFNYYLVFMRIVTSLFSLLGVIFTALLAKRLNKNIKVFLITLALAALNWKLAAHSHYLNQDTYLMVLFVSSYYFLISFMDGNKENENSIKSVKYYIPLGVSSLLLGLATGTKITALIVVPIIFLVLFLKKDLKSILLYIFGIFIGFALSNPFSIINFSSFLSRLILMKSVEAGVVFTSVNTNPFKYILYLFHLLTPLVFILSVVGMCEAVKNIIRKVKDKNLNDACYSHIILIGSAVIYILFFSLTPRLTDRWLLPIIPILLIYSTFGFMLSENILEKRRVLKIALLVITALIYFYYSFTLINQLNIGKPRVNAYLWVKEYFSSSENENKKILMYTNKGDRDPFAKIKNIEMHMLMVYESRGALGFYPKNPMNYDFIILHSSFENNFKNRYVMNKYPDYYNTWMGFYNTVNDPSRFQVLRRFKTTKLDLIGVPEIYIYKRVE